MVAVLIYPAIVKTCACKQLHIPLRAGLLECAHLTFDVGIGGILFRRQILVGMVFRQRRV